MSSSTPLFVIWLVLQALAAISVLIAAARKEQGWKVTAVLLVAAGLPAGLLLWAGDWT